MENRNDLIPALMRMYASMEAEIDPEFNQFGIRRAENQEQAGRGGSPVYRLLA